MSLNQQIDSVIMRHETIEQLEVIAEDFAIGFVSWIDKNKKQLSKLIMKYKKEKGL